MIEEQDSASRESREVEMTKRTVVSAVLLSLLFFGFPSSVSAKSRAETRARIDRMAKETLDRVLKESGKAGRLYEKAVAYAVFDNVKLSLFISGGGGLGVAIDKKSGARTYMNMGTVGLNLGLGGQKYQVLFLFQDKETFDDFVEKGWRAGVEANAVAGTAGANAGADFTNGMAVYQVTEAGLMLQADISGTKYWKARKLNSQ